MIRMHVLVGGLEPPNVTAFLFPLLRFRDALRDAGIEWRMFREGSAAAADCDVLVVEDRYFGPRWSSEPEQVVEELSQLRARGPRLCLADLSDSTGFLKTAALPAVDVYIKNQVLRDRRSYLEPLYGARLFTDFYHRTAGVTDDSPVFQQPVADAALLDKIRVGWNSGLADYSFQGLYRQLLFARTGWPRLLRHPRRFVPAERRRPLAVSCRIGTNYHRATVAWQRQQVQRRLHPFAPAGRLSRRRYFAELASSRLVVSPFGFGEINYRDYETFLSGAALLKPDMSHLETWPDLFRTDETVIVHRWDLSDLTQVTEAAVDEPDRCRDVAAAAQAAYRRHLDPATGPALFAAHVRQAILPDTGQA